MAGGFWGLGLFVADIPFYHHFFYPVLVILRVLLLFQGPAETTEAAAPAVFLSDCSYAFLSPCQEALSSSPSPPVALGVGVTVGGELFYVVDALNDLTSVSE